MATTESQSNANREAKSAVLNSSDRRWQEWVLDFDVVVRLTAIEVFGENRRTASTFCGGDDERVPIRDAEFLLGGDRALDKREVEWHDLERSEFRNDFGRLGR